MRDKQDGLRLATALAIVAAVATTACVDHSVVAPSGPRGHPTFALVPGSGATRGALLAEAVITIPESGAASGVVPLIASGQVTGPVLIEMVSAVRFSGGGTVPASEALFPGVTMYFRPNGDLYLRYLSAPVFAVSPGGAISYQQPPTLGPSDSVALVDASAPAHGLQIIWETADEQFTTLNAHDPGFSGECAFDITFICQVGPAFGPSRISAGPPSGTIVVRVYQATLPTEATLTVSCPSTVERGQLGTCSAGTEPSTATLEVLGWTFRADSGGGVLERADAPQATEWSGPMVTSGTVQVHARVNGALDSAAAHIGVTPRDWSGMRVALEVSENSPGMLKIRPDTQADLGKADLGDTLDIGALAIVNAGPNQGYQYFGRIPLRAQATVSINTAAMSLGSAFYLLQENDRRRIGGQVYCSRNDVVSMYLPEVRRHEGTGGASDANSHVAIYLSRLEREARKAFEGMVSREAFPGIGAVIQAVHDTAAADSKAMDDDSRNPFVPPCVLRYFPRGIQRE